MDVECCSWYIAHSDWMSARIGARAGEECEGASKYNKHNAIGRCTRLSHTSIGVDKQLHTHIYICKYTYTHT